MRTVRVYGKNKYRVGYTRKRTALESKNTLDIISLRKRMANNILQYVRKTYKLYWPPKCGKRSNSRSRVK